MNARYPNLELLEYKARVALSQDEEFLKLFEEKKRNNKYAYAEIDAVMFPQIWGSTCTGFDVTEDGSPAIGGCSMTKNTQRCSMNLAPIHTSYSSARRYAIK